MTNSSRILRTIIFSAYLMAGSIANAEQCEPSQWGADDQIGSANLVTTERVVAAAALIKKGERHPLGIVIDQTTPAFPPRSLALQIVQPGQHNNRSTEQDFGWPMIYNDDLVQMWLGIGSQLDGLGHMGEGDEYYNCHKASEFIDINGLKKLGTHQVPPLVGRGIMLDMAKHFGVTAMKAGETITPDDIKAAAKEQNISFSTGDIILFHTGWTDATLNSDPQTWGSMEPGLSNQAAAYIATFNPVAVGADTWGLEAVPQAEGDLLFYGHVELLKKHGIYILETMNTGRLAREGVHEFMFVLGQARVRGTVQMVINPVAMW